MLLPTISRSKKKKKMRERHLSHKTGSSLLTIDLVRKLCNLGQILRERGEKKEKNSCAKLEKYLSEWSEPIDLKNLSYG